jgi:hypothetical protein
VTYPLWLQILAGTCGGVALLVVVWRLVYLRPMAICMRCRQYPESCQCTDELEESKLRQELTGLASDWAQHQPWEEGEVAAARSAGIRHCGLRLLEILHDVEISYHAIDYGFTPSGPGASSGTGPRDSAHSSPRPGGTAHCAVPQKGCQRPSERTDLP